MSINPSVNASTLLYCLFLLPDRRPLRFLISSNNYMLRLLTSDDLIALGAHLFSRVYTTCSLFSLEACPMLIGRQAALAMALPSATDFRRR